VLATGVRVGHDEIDIVALEPGRTYALVFVEVRSHTTARFGLPEESVDGRKVGRLYRSALTLRRLGQLADGTPLPRVAWRVDLILVDVAPAIAADVGGPVLRHIRGIRPD
jgi:Holliday junction resolvase-like predicted endonuclease